MPAEKPLSIRLLGPPEASLRGRGLRFGTRKALALLCFLAAEGRRHPRGELAELLWPRSDRRRARTDLRSTLSRLRRVCGEGGARSEGGGEGAAPFAVEGDLLGVEPAAVELDLGTLEAAVSLAPSGASAPSPGIPPGGRSANGAVGHGDLLARLEGALGIYGGEFMEGFSLKDAPEFELWLDTERVRWRTQFGELCERVSRLQAEAGRPEEAIGTARLWTKHAPLEEDAHRRLMELLFFRGDSEGALRAYEYFRGALGRELGLEPSARLAELAGRLREEVWERASLATVSAPSTTTSLSALEMPFVNRQEEFGALVSEYEACVSGQEPRAVAVMGEAGMGKTRLVREFLGWAKARGTDVLEGAASEGARLSYGPLLEAIRPRIERERAPEDLLEDAWLAELSRLLPELKERYPDLPPAPSGEGGTAKGALFEAIARTVGAMAARAPVVLFLDDLQWADAATLEVLDYAGRRWAEEGTPVLVLVAARPEKPVSGSGLRRWLSTSGRSLARSLVLGPLENEDVEDLLRRLTGVEPWPAGTPKNPEVPNEARSRLRSFGEWLAVESGGQPFYLTETLKALLENGELVVRSRAHAEAVVEISPSFRAANNPAGLLPSSVREVIRSRLSQLSPAAFDLLSAGAVLGRGFGFEPLLAVSGLEEAEGLRGLDELTDRRLLLEGGSAKAGATPLQQGAAYYFSHEKIRQVAYTDCGRARRWVLHRRAFEVLKGSGAPPTELARHALAGGLVEETFAYSVAAGDNAAEVFAVQDAIRHYERARDLLAAKNKQPGGAIEPSISNVEHLYRQLGRAYEMADEWVKAHGAYETMLAAAREAGEARLEVIALNHLAISVFHYESDVTKVRALLEKALKVALEAGLSEALAETQCNLADSTALRAAEIGHSLPFAVKALASARALERQDLVARALTALARVETFAGRLEEAGAHAEEGATLCRELVERPTLPQAEFPSMLAGVTGLSASWRAGARAMEIRCRLFLANIRNFQGRPREGMAVAREVMTIAEELPERMAMMSVMAIGGGLLDAGEYEELLALTRRGIEQARKARDVYLLGANLGRLGQTYEALENLKEARAAYEEAMEIGHYGEFSHARYCVLAALAEDWEEAHAQAKSAHYVGMFFNPIFTVDLHREVEALMRGGDEELAREEARRLAERAEANERDRMSYLRALAVLDEWEGDTEGAVARLREAEALAEGIGLPGELWQIRAKIGELHERRGEASEAHRAFSRAAQTLGGLAARIEDEGLREGFLAAPRVRRVLEHR